MDPDDAKAGLKLHPTQSFARNVKEVLGDREKTTGHAHPGVDVLEAELADNGCGQLDGKGQQNDPVLEQEAAEAHPSDARVQTGRRTR